jgi:AmiR/NasT family two-component response regulator
MSNSPAPLPLPVDRRFPSEAGEPRPATRVLHILAAAHDPAIAEFFRQALTGAGHEVCLVQREQHLLELLRRARFDVLVTDLPLVEHLERDRGMSLPPPVVLVSTSLAGFPRSMEGRPFPICLLFPLKAEDLQSAVHLARRRFERDLRQRQAAVELQEALERRRQVQRVCRPPAEPEPCPKVFLVEETD